MFCCNYFIMFSNILSSKVQKIDIPVKFMMVHNEKSVGYELKYS